MLLTESLKFTPSTVERIPYPQQLQEAVQLSDGSSAGGLLKVRGIFQRYDCVNSNGRRYTRPLFDRVLKEDSVVEAFNTRAMLGLLEHPEDGLTKLDRIPSHYILKAWDAGDGNILGEAVILNTSTGRDLAAIFEAGCSVGISSRGDGECRVCEGVNEVIPETFRLITWDFVYDNSVPGARPRPVQESSSPPVKLDEQSDDIPALITAIRHATKMGDQNKIKSLKDRLRTVALRQDKLTDPSVLDAISEASNSQTPIQESQQYLSTPSPSESIPMKLGDLRQLDLKIRELGNLNIRKLPFQSRAAISESLMTHRGSVEKAMNEDVSLKGYGSKLIKLIEEFEDDLENIAPEGPPPPGADMGAPGAEEVVEVVSKEDFDKILNVVLSSLCAGCDLEKSGPIIDKAYEAFTAEGTFDVQSMVDELKASGASAADDQGGEADGFEDLPPADIQEASVAIIAELTESLRQAQPEKVKEYRKLLSEAHTELIRRKPFDENRATLAQNLKLLKEAKDELEKYEESIQKKDAQIAGLIELCKKHGIKDANALKEACVDSKTGKDKCADVKEGELGEFEGDLEKEGKEKEEKKTTDEGAPPVVTNPPLTEAVHPFLRIIKRQRTGAGNQLNS